MKKLLFLVYILCSYATYGQSVSGLVVDPESKPIPSVTVAVKGSNKQTYTDDGGRFTIDVGNSPSNLIFSGLMVHRREVSLRDSTSTVKIVLERRENALDEIQVVGYGTSTKRYNLGSVTSIKAEDFETQAVSNPLAVLQGRVPGLVVSSTSGMPGASFTVQLRGQNSVNTNRGTIPPMDNPLFIIDGVPFATQNENINRFSSAMSPGSGRMFNNAYGGLSPFNSINPDDIASIEVLRDADATAIYGSRAGNGVILITTKKGKQGKTEFTWSANSGIGVLGYGMQLMNTTQYLEMREEAYKNDGRVPSDNPASSTYAPDLLLFDRDRNVNWKDEFFGKKSRNSIVNLGLSGGNAQTQFRFGTNYHKATFNFPGDFSDQKVGMILGIHHGTNDKKLTFDFSGTYNHGKNNSSSAPNLLLAANLQPNYPHPYGNNGDLIWNYRGVSLNGAVVSANPYAYLLQQYAMGTDALNSNMVFSYKPIPGLNIRSSFGVSNFRTDEYSGSPKSSRTPEFNPIAEANFGNSSFTSLIVEPQVEYTRRFGGLEMGALLGGTLQSNMNKSNEVYASGYMSDELIGSIAGAPNKNASDRFSEYRYGAIFGRVKLNLHGKYLFSSNFRRDGSSRFGPGRQFGNFGSIGAGWLFNEEHFIKNAIPVLSFGKLRGSYGVTGSDGIGDYNFLSRWQPTFYQYAGQLGFAPVNHFNDQFSWATTKKLEFALELGFFGDRLLLTTAWYRNRTGNQLVNYSLPISTGFGSVVQNWDAVVENNGLEAILQVSLLKKSAFSWSSSFNLTIPQNRLLSFPGLAESSYATMYTVGRSLRSLYLFRYAGVDPASGIFTFSKNDGTITSTPQDAQNGNFNDLYYAGNTDPRYFGGMMNSFSYGALKLDIFMEFRKQIGKNFLGQVYNYRPGGTSNMPVELLDRWQEEGDVAAYQQYSTVSNSAAGRATRIFVNSDEVYSDASYIRLKMLSLSYDLPVSYLKGVGAQRLNIFTTAQNLLTFTRFRGNDPETQSFYGVPPLKSFILGLQMKF
ncbi:SusC/RagA family TonB-linked outer membrane protein [Sphingobacterium pedocola]|uniref:SusC/RagA family TonB-linked outer membrane protein n=1 Tax=Sphingobacterium pedocola TaxID=2082722 RepID=A0ABR9TC97_9SPHI|nr:SusC/RagA family TonB-linked outer membrane protein [Sphingobacterium pedocola]MBE8722978.1 SusC/RagA family TonB-linked outer membrane protein [Sphingobacterium pedocola]